jgi:hypothetical protein
MKWLLIILFSGAAIFGIVKNTNHNKKDTAHLEKSSSSFAILELFTSEGCSSCPPADRLLPQLASADPNIIAMSFHVDYWNHLGWTDPFSKTEFSERQREYAERFHLKSIYTPQLIINGEYELVGSSRSTAEADIKKVLNEKSAVRIEIDGVKNEGNKLSISCHLEGEWAKTSLTAVVVQKHAEMKVKAGENGGRKLSHTNVVRSFIQKPAMQKMNFEIEIPGDLTNNSSQLILYTQQNDLKITGATVSDLK